MIYVLFEKHFLTITLNILYIKVKEICAAYISKISLYCEKQIILLMIPNDGIIWNHYALSCSKKTVCIITRNNTKHRGNFYCLNCLHSFRTKNKKESKNKDF